MYTLQLLPGFGIRSVTDLSELSNNGFTSLYSTSLSLSFLLLKVGR